MMESITLVGIDTGGTFTDIVVLEDKPEGGSLRQCKVLSDPKDPSSPIVEGLEKLGLVDRNLQIIHGTTVGTNAVLEDKGARVAYVTSKGFADVLSLGRYVHHPEFRKNGKSAQCDLHGRWSPKSDMVGFNSVNSGQRQVYIIKLH